jgi:hypothetical protein
LVGSTSPEKRWILKYPVHMKHLAALLEVYPDACIVQTHRDPTKVLSSYISLIAGFRALFERDIDRAAIAREQVEVWAAGADRAIAVRRQHDPAQFFDLQFRDFVGDPIGSVRRIYDQFGLTLTDAAKTRLRAWQASNPEGKHGKHQHSMEDVGVTRDQKGLPVALVVTPERMVERRVLTTDRVVGSSWLVTGGLRPGEQVIVEGLQKVRPGVLVNPVAVAATSAPPPAAGGTPSAPAPR